MAETSSGENVIVNGRTIVNFIMGTDRSSEKEKVLQQIAKLRRDANQINPPNKKTASPLTISDIQELTTFVRARCVPEAERQALEIVIVAFASISRVSEIVSLRWEDVDPGGAWISVITKTNASTGKRIVKKLSDWGPVRPTEILIRRRREALKAGRELLFVGARSGKPPVAADVTHALRSLTGRAGWRRRISSHSARRGGAVAAVMAGIPLQIVQAFGDWKSADTLQIYIGEALRNEYCFLDMLERKYRR